MQIVKNPDGIMLDTISIYLESRKIRVKKEVGTIYNLIEIGGEIICSNFLI
jgi:hypothetical protein